MKTFAQYLIDKTLPAGMEITKQVDSGYLSELLTTVGRKYPEQYDKVVSRLKRLGDRFSTYEPVTMGLDEISTPNKAERNKIISKYTKLVDKETDPNKVVSHLEALQNDLAANDVKDANDDATLMVRSALKSGKYQLMKLRTSPGVVADNRGGIVPEIFPKSYAEGVDPLHFWLGATESRKNVAQGQVSTAKPGEMNKLISNVLNTAVVSKDDCGTERGIQLSTRDEDIVDRYLAEKAGNFPRNTLITADVQQELLKASIPTVCVRSPETCNAPAGSVCCKCMGIRPGTGKIYQIGDNAGLITAGSLGEPMTQMTLSSKHSTALAKKMDGLTGEAGFRQLVEQPKLYLNRKMLCEVFGKIFRIRMAPQGGWTITIRQTRPVPDRYIIHAKPTPNLKMHWDYHVPPNLKVADGIEEGSEVWPSLPLSTGVDNLQDIARLRNLASLRSAAAQNMYDVYKNTGNKMDRRHFELLARNAHPYIRIEKAPYGFGAVSGETVSAGEFSMLASKAQKASVPVDSCLDMVLAEDTAGCPAGFGIDVPTQKVLKDAGVKNVSVLAGVEISTVATPLSRNLNKSNDWLGAMNHRYLKDQAISAASWGKKSDIHGYNPLTAYAYGAEFGKASDDGRY